MSYPWSHLAFFIFAQNKLMPPIHQPWPSMGMINIVCHFLDNVDSMYMGWHYVYEWYRYCQHLVLYVWLLENIENVFIFFVLPVQWTNANFCVHYIILVVQWTSLAQDASSAIILDECKIFVFAFHLGIPMQVLHWLTKFSIQKPTYSTLTS